jgi:hypothetical protein
LPPLQRVKATMEIGIANAISIRAARAIRQLGDPEPACSTDSTSDVEIGLSGTFTQISLTHTVVQLSQALDADIPQMTIISEYQRSDLGPRQQFRHRWAGADAPPAFRIVTKGGFIACNPCFSGCHLGDGGVDQAGTRGARSRATHARICPNNCLDTLHSAIGTVT